MRLSMVIRGLFLTSLLILPSLGQAAYIAQTTARCGIGSAGAEFGTWSAIHTCNYSPVSDIQAAASVASGVNTNGILNSKSSLRIINIDNEYVSGFEARARIQYSDLVTFTTSVLPDDAEFIVRISAQMTGITSIDDVSLGFPLLSSGELTVRIGGGSGSDTRVEQTGGLASWDSPFDAFNITVRNGQVLGLTMDLTTVAQLAGVGYTTGTAFIVTDFSNTAGITGFEYFDLDGNPLSGDFSSRDGLTLYDPSIVPVPAAAWLFGSGLIGLIALARRKKL